MKKTEILFVSVELESRDLMVPYPERCFGQGNKVSVGATRRCSRNPIYCCNAYKLINKF